MAVYGLNPVTGVATNGLVPFTGWTSTLGAGPANVGAAAGNVSVIGISQDDYKVVYHLAKASNRAVFAVLKAITGAVAGGNVSSTYSRVQAQNPPANGAIVPIETKTNISTRATTAADVAAFTALWSRVVNPVPYVADASGSGGGGQLWFIGVR